MIPRPAEDSTFRHSVDVLRGLAIVGVVTLHFGGSFVTAENAWTPSFELGLFLNQFFSFGVPLFVLLAGAVGRRSCERPDFSIIGFYRHRLVRLGVPYLATSAVSFWMFNHLAEWRDLATTGLKISWLFEKLFLFGIEPTFYFVPLLLQLTILQPFLVQLPKQLSQWLCRGKSRAALDQDYLALYLAIGLFGLHIAVAQMCYRGILNYYILGRPSAILWVFIFFVGLHRNSWGRFLAKRSKSVLLAISGATASCSMTANWLHMHNRLAVGASFEHSLIDFAYVRPIIFLFNLAIVASCLLVLDLGWPLRNRWLEFLGRSTYSIYLWHILVLYELAWARPDVLESCRRLPELIVLISLAVSLAIAAAAETLHSSPIWKGRLKSPISS